jgi:hypothetical protein
VSSHQVSSHLTSSVVTGKLGYDWISVCQNSARSERYHKRLALAKASDIIAPAVAATS